MNRYLRTPVATQPCLIPSWCRFSEIGVSAHVVDPEAVSARMRKCPRAYEDMERLESSRAGAIRRATWCMSATSTRTVPTSTGTIPRSRTTISVPVSPEWLAKAHDLPSWAFVCFIQPPSIFPISTATVETSANPASFKHRVECARRKCINNTRSWTSTRLRISKRELPRLLCAR